MLKKKHFFSFVEVVEPDLLKSLSYAKKQKLTKADALQKALRVKALEVSSRKLSEKVRVKCQEKVQEFM